jgi:hypothetical protein
MKKIIITTVLFLAVGFSTLFAQSNNRESSYLQASFREQIPAAGDISWKQGKNYTEATYTIDNKQLTFYYDADNKLFAVSRNITSDQLPLFLLGDIKRNYSNYWITGLFELSIDNHSNYYLTLENADGRKILMADSYSEWYNYKP